MNIRHIVKRFVRGSFGVFGFDIIKSSRNSEKTLFGIASLPICSVIDVGANKGQFAREIFQIFPKAKICCFEPLPGPFEELSRWAKKQNGKVHAFNMALGDREGSTKMFSHVDHSPSSSLLRATEQSEEMYPFTKKKQEVTIEVAKLDNAVESLGVDLGEHILIKLDVQGYEDRVIIGGTETFKKACACILEVCFDKLYEDQTTFKDVLLLLDALGFRYSGNIKQVSAVDGHIIYADALFINSSKVRG